MISVPAEGRERLAGWWLMEEQSNHGHGLCEWVERRVSVPLWLVQGYAWAVVGGWTGVTLAMGWQIWGAGGTLWSCAVVTVASHQVRTGLNRVAEVRRWAGAEQAWQELGASFKAPAEQPVNETEVRGMVSLARQGLVEQPDPVEAADKLVEVPPERAVGQSPAKTMGQALAQLVAKQAIGTNRGLLLFLWMLVSGNLGESGGAIFPALQRMGLDETDSRRVWAAFAEGKWEISDLLKQWQQQVEAEGLWQEHRLGGYRVKAVDRSIATERLQTRIQNYAKSKNITLEQAAQQMPREMRIARFGDRAENARAVAFLASSQAAYIQGAILDVDGRVTRAL